MPVPRSAFIASDAIPEADGRADRALGVVLVGGRHAEDGHEAVAHDRRHDAAEVLDDEPQRRHGRPQEGVHVLGVERLRERGVAGQVGEQDRQQLAFGRGDRLTADRAPFVAGSQDAPARGAGA